MFDLASKVAKMIDDFVVTVGGVGIIINIFPLFIFYMIAKKLCGFKKLEKYQSYVKIGTFLIVTYFYIAESSLLLGMDVSLLIMFGRYLKLTNAKPSPSLHSTRFDVPIELTAMTDDASSLKSLLFHGKHPDRPCLMLGHTALTIAAGMGNMKSLKGRYFPCQIPHC